MIDPSSMHPSTREWGATRVPLPMRLPTLTEQLIPKRTSSPMMAPNFRRPVDFPQTFTDPLSCRRFATLVPAPKLHPLPMTLSPM